jgi:hypothetical protein
VFLVVGQRGSEARAVARALDAHPDLVVAGAGEIIVPLAFLVQRVSDPPTARRLAADLITSARGFEDGIGRHLDADQVGRALADAPTRLGPLLATLLDAVADAAGAAEAGTLLTVMGNPVLNRTGLYEGGLRLVHVVRDVRSVVADADGHQAPVDIARQWDQANRLFHQRRGGDPTTYHLVRVEDLARHPGRELDRLARFLDVGPRADPPAPDRAPRPALDRPVRAEVEDVAREGLYDFGYVPARWSPRRWLREAGRQGRRVLARARRLVRKGRDRAWALRVPPPWEPPGPADTLAPAWCNVCRWRGPAFAGHQHAESADCPRCGSIARERFHLHGLTPPADGRLTVVEVAPRLRGSRDRAMGRWVDHVVVDDLGAVEQLEEASADRILTAHDLQTVVDPDAALAGLHRVLRPGGQLLLQVPVLSGTTTALDTPAGAAPGTAHWAFGLDLAGRLDQAGFRTEVLVTEELAELATSDPGAWGEATSSGEVDLHGLLEAASTAPLHPIADRPTARRAGWLPPVLFLTFQAEKVA